MKLAAELPGDRHSSTASPLCIESVRFYFVIVRRNIKSLPRTRLYSPIISTSNPNCFMIMTSQNQRYKKEELIRVDVPVGSSVAAWNHFVSWSFIKRSRVILRFSSITPFLPPPFFIPPPSSRNLLPPSSMLFLSLNTVFEGNDDLVV